ncbi:hypothetical protein EHM92_01070 [bacterium]|nr:MAG: hypothetical protein EHM92_01070 [bacterium]
MTIKSGIPLALLCIALACAYSTGQSQDQSVQRKDVPPKVLEAFQTSYPRAAIKGYSKEIVHDTVSYEIESVEGKIRRDITYRADGSLVVIEESIPFVDLPEPVRSAIAKGYPKAKVNQCEKIIEGSTTQFEVQLASGKEKLEVVYNADGAVVRKEKK